jgi:hypothetical protein
MRQPGFNRQAATAGAGNRLKALRVADVESLEGLITRPTASLFAVSADRERAPPRSCRAQRAGSPPFAPHRAGPVRYILQEYVWRPRRRAEEFLGRGCSKKLNSTEPGFKPTPVNSFRASIVFSQDPGGKDLQKFDAQQPVPQKAPK